MDQLREKLELENCKIVDRSWYPAEPQPTNVLTVEAPLTTSIAEILKCRNMAFNLNDQPNRFDGTFGLTHEVEDAELKLSTPNGALLSFYPKVVKKFRIGHDKQENLTVRLRAHFSGYETEIQDWYSQTNKKEFNLVLIGAQGSLFDQPSKQDGEAGGTRVDMSGTGAHRGEDSDCVDCNNGVPLMEGDPSIHVSMQPCRSYKPSHAEAEEAEETKEAEEGATLAPAVLMGGTHASPRRGRHSRDRDREAIADGSAPLEEEVTIEDEPAGAIQ